MKVSIEIPSYISIKDYSRIQNLEHLTDLEKTLEIVHVLSGIEKDVIREWDLASLGRIANDLTECLGEEPQFHPIIEWNDTLYGYQPINKMKLGEYTDLERLIKAGNTSLNEVAAILYRPIDKHSFLDIAFTLKHNIKLSKNKSENIFKHYTLEKYDSETRDGKLFDDFPIQFLLGALTFFLGSVNNYFLNTQAYSQIPKRKRKAMESQMQSLLLNTGDGLLRFITSLNPTYLQSAGTSRSLTVT